MQWFYQKIKSMDILFTVLIANGSNLVDVWRDFVHYIYAVFGHNKQLCFKKAYILK